MRLIGLFFVLCLAALCSPVSAVPMDMHAGTKPQSWVHHLVSTKNARAQSYFDRGLTYLYAYNRPSARHAFEAAAKMDPNLAMAHWGVAISLGSNINVSVSPDEEKQAYAEVRKALALSGSAGDLDRAWIHALQARYSNVAQPDYAKLAVAYHAAMRRLVQTYPDDLDAATLYAESAMELHPWALFTPAGIPVEGTQEIVATLESVLARAPDHIGANHFYIHTVEASLHPERALICAARLSALNFASGAAHLVHMPAHIYMRTGDFGAAVMSNEHATEHDRAFLAAEPEPELSGYYSHNLTMLAQGYSMLGEYAAAKRTADQLQAQSAFVPAMYVPLRFGRWSDILAAAKPAASDAEPMRVAFWHFSRGMALAATKDLTRARAELDALKAEDAALKVGSIAGYTNSSAALLGLGEDVLGAKIADAGSDAATAIAKLERAVSVQDALLYIEPPDWYAPEREALGGALLRHGDAARAAQVFRDDLVRNPRNARSLYGLSQSLRAMGRLTDAALVDQQFKAAWRWADTRLTVADL